GLRTGGGTAASRSVGTRWWSCLDPTASSVSPEPGTPPTEGGENPTVAVLRGGGPAAGSTRAPAPDPCRVRRRGEGHGGGATTTPEPSRAAHWAGNLTYSPAAVEHATTPGGLAD